MPTGYNGKILRVNLSDGSMREENPPESVYRMYMGGSALSSYYLLKEQKPGVDPLGPENMLIFMSSVISGAPLPGLTRYTVAARSPLTGAFGEAEAGGFFGPELKMAGYDGIIFTGRSPKPVYLWIKDGKAEIRDASKIWGKDTGEAEKRIREELGDNRIRVAQCGPAGEKMVRYACVVNELKHANGRCGMGAVMGSKNLRAVAVRGTQRLTFADPERVKGIAKEVLELLPQSALAQNLKKFGTPMFVMPLHNSGILPTRNFQKGQFEKAEAICGEKMTDTILVKSEGCYACAVQCKRAVKVEGKYNASPEYGGPEYETVASLGSYCGVDNLAAIAQGNEMCNRLGLDTISMGVAIGMAMELVEKGILTRKDTDEIDLQWGNADAMLAMIGKAARREGFGALLAEGVQRMAEKIGKGAEKYAMHIKGQELPMHDPRGKQGLSLSYATSPTGADHIEAPHDTSFLTEGPALKASRPAGLMEPVPAMEMGPRKVRQFAHTQAIWNAFNSMGVCNFAAAPYTAFPLVTLAEAVAAITGWNASLYEIMELGERTVTMARMFNIREGLSSKDDYLPERLFETLEAGTPREKKITREDFANTLKLYYQAMGWDPQTGIPTEGRLGFLGLDWLIPKK
ncbi:MAG TPA: aldehyde ferredoxin oxidoreductase family protein [Thermodesulfobacteriota bacterium]|nr:aldehyde ferredoxin oxidoreductase family protein [Thermodesulfobacteriota bacterium]